MALLTKTGYGQVEPNHLSAQRNGQIYAQLPLDPALDSIENGHFAVYDYAAGEVNLDGTGEPMLVFNEVKVYDARETTKDFALTKANAVSGEVIPRLFKTNVGDVFTTNLVDHTTAVGPGLVGLKFVPTAGVLTEKLTPVAGDLVFTVVAVTTLPDGQPALKLQRTV